jgi:transposase
MPKEIHADYSKRFLLPPSLDDWVPSNHPSRFLRLFVDSLDLKTLGFKERESEEGRPNYSNDLLLRIWLYGYFYKINSSRNLERACHHELPLIWLTGMNYPDHNTLWRFFRNNRAVLKNVFKQTVRVAVQSEMVGFVLQAVDGTKVLADVSSRRSIHKVDVKNLLSKLDAILEERLTEIENQEKAESSQPGFGLPKSLQNKEKLQSLIKKGLEDLSMEEKKSLRTGLQSHLSNLEHEDANHLSITDKDARVMKNGNTKRFSYNAQSVVDSKEQVVVGSKVSQSVSDNHHLTEMIDEAKDNTGGKSSETVADGGYFSGEELKKSEERGHSVLVNKSSSVGKSVGNDKGDFNKDNFRFDKKSDHYVCPLGKVLVFERTKRSKKRSSSRRVYRCKSFRDCPNRDQCSQDPRGRSIERSPYDDVIKRQLQKQKVKKNQEFLSERKKIVEPVFGWIKRNLGFRRWTYRGIESVNAQWNMVCTTINLKKIYKKWLEGTVSLG